MIREDLDPRADDEHHKQHVQEMLCLQPPGEAGIDRRCRLGDPGVGLDECLDARELPQALRKSDQEHQSGCGDWYSPESAEPAPRDTNLGDDARPRWQPMGQDDPVVRGAQGECDRIVRRRLDDGVRHG
jgi:hypothetical protein